MNSTSGTHEDLFFGIFNVIVREAQKNPVLAKELIEAIAEGPTPRPETTALATRKRFDASEFHAVNILRLHGESRSVANSSK